MNALIDQKQLAHPIRPVDELTSQNLDDVHDAAQLALDASDIDPRWESVHESVLNLELAVHPVLGSDYSAAAQDEALRAAVEACAVAAAQ